MTAIGLSLTLLAAGMALPQWQEVDPTAPESRFEMYTFACRGGQRGMAMLIISNLADGPAFSLYSNQFPSAPKFATYGNTFRMFVNSNKESGYRSRLVINTTYEASPLGFEFRYGTDQGKSIWEYEASYKGDKFSGHCDHIQNAPGAQSANPNARVKQ